MLNLILSELNIPKFPNVLAGTEGSEDAGIYRLSNETALVQSVDFFTPVVDEPFIFGTITACNALSDIYAMGGEPITAMNLLEFPVKELSAEYIKEILSGALSVLNETGTALIGGHSVDGKELKFGLSVTGVINPNKIFRNNGAEKGDVLILTKKIGTGAIATAIKGNLVSDEAKNKAVEVMTTLNKNAAEIIRQYEGVHAVTDITGFGLAGHLIEMLSASCKNGEIYFDNIPVIEEAKEYLEIGLIPEGTYNNIDFFSCRVKLKENIDDIKEFLLYDPQTSGGLLISAEKESGGRLLEELQSNSVDASIIGAVTEDGTGKVIVY